MNAEQRIEVIQELFKAGQVNQFKDIFGMWGFPRTSLAKALGINNALIQGYVTSPQRFTQYQIQKIADYFGLPYAEIQSSIDRQVENEKKPG